MPMASDVASRDHYLTLALFSRRIIEALRDVVVNGNRTRLKAALPEAIESLRIAKAGQRHVSSSRRAIRNYEQVRTITELLPGEHDRRNMIQTLKSLQREMREAEQKQAALTAMKFFFAIEYTALRNYRHPSPHTRRTSRGLCRTQATTSATQPRF
jgi:hypothetical protein